MIVYEENKRIKLDDVTNGVMVKMLKNRAIISFFWIKAIGNMSNNIINEKMEKIFWNVYLKNTISYKKWRINYDSFIY